MRKQWILVSVALLALLVACNGSSGAPANPTEQAATAVAAIEATRAQRLTVVPSSDATPAAQVTPGAAEPQPESRGDRIAFWRDNGQAVDIIVMDPDTGEELNLTNNYKLHAFRPVWSPDGVYLAFVYDKEDNWDIYFAPADGSARLPRELTISQNPDLYPQWSPDGALITYYSFIAGQFDILRVDVATHVKANLTAETPDSSESHAVWSPDGQSILFISDRDGNDEYYLMSRDGWDVRRLTQSENANEWDATWSPDGRQIAFVSDRDGDPEIYMIQVDGSELRRITENPAEDGIPTWSPDGQSLLFATDRDGNVEIYWLDLACLAAESGCESQGVNLTQSVGDDSLPAWSPDASRIAFVSTRVDGKEDIFLMQPDGSNQVNLTETAGAQEWGPAWAPVPPQ